MEQVINGIKISEGIIRRIGEKIKKDNLKLKLSVVLVGNDSVSLSYVSQKKQACQKAGVDFSLHCFSKGISKEELIKKINQISKYSSGVIIQLPLPFKERFEQEILNSVPEKKDVDILSEKKLGKFYTGDFSVLPPVVGAVSHIVKKEKINLRGKKITIFGSGKLVGKPLSIWLMAQGATISVINEFSKDVDFFTKKSDIVISGVGKWGIVKGSLVKKGVIAIDAGSSFQKGIIRGDFDPLVYKKASLYTPVPGGIGPITTACLLENLIKMNEY